MKSLGAVLLIAAIAFLLARDRPWSAALLWLAALPLWMPDLLVTLRNYIFTRINGADGMLFPSATVNGKVSL